MVVLSKIGLNFVHNQLKAFHVTLTLTFPNYTEINSGKVFNSVGIGMVCPKRYAFALGLAYLRKTKSNGRCAQSPIWVLHFV